MRGANSKTNEELIKKLKLIKELIDTTIDLVHTQRLGNSKMRSMRGNSSIKKSYTDIDLSKPIRPFVKQYGVGMSGPKKFTLILAHLTGGDLKKKASLDEIQKCWGRMTAKNLLGMKFNRFYSAQAKDNDWVNTEQSGLYHLRPSWKDIFNEGR